MPRPTGAVMRVADALLRRIISEEYSPGLRLPSEVDLATEFGCGRSTIREALRHLAGLNLVQSRRGSGAVVLDYRREGGLELMPDWFKYGRFEHPLPVIVGEMLRMRGMLACEAARLAALYARPDALVVIRKQIEAAHAVRDKPLDHALRELEIYRSLTHASAMWPATWLANAFIGPMREHHRIVANPLTAVQDNWRDVMNELMAMVDKHDADHAIAHLRSHFERVDRQIAEGLQGIFARSHERGSP
jgi:GntR family transcriptional regulator, transcriptional repressor for pyruvate dehydrogenase complex